MNLFTEEIEEYSLIRTWNYCHPSGYAGRVIEYHYPSGGLVNGGDINKSKRGLIAGSRNLILGKLELIDFGTTVCDAELWRPMRFVKQARQDATERIRWIKKTGSTNTNRSVALL